MSNNHLQEFCAIFSLTNLIKESIRFKNLEKPTVIDHILTNHPKSFQHSGTYEMGLFDFQKLTYTKSTTQNSNTQLLNIDVVKTLIMIYLEVTF